MRMTAAVMRMTAAVTRKTKSMLPRTMVTATAIVWAVRMEMTVSFLTQVTKKRETKKTRSKIEECLQRHGPVEHCQCVT